MTLDGQDIERITVRVAELFRDLTHPANKRDDKRWPR